MDYSKTTDHDVKEFAQPPSPVSGNNPLKAPLPAYDPTYAQDDGTETDAGPIPTEEELLTLRRVSDKIPWDIYTIAFVELVERFSFYGTTVVFTNFISQPLPDGTTTGAGYGSGQAGALDMGQQAATGITTFNQFWCYLIPLFGAYIADTYLGRYRTICWSVLIAVIGHVILTASAAPSLLTAPSTANSLAPFLIGLIIMGVGTGGFKPNISPLVAEQLPHAKKHVRVEKNGERVIVDPAVTTLRVYNWFYLMINIGALIGQLAMSYSSYYVGFWLAFLIPTVLFAVFCPAVLLYARRRYKRTPPEGSVLAPAMRLLFLASKGRWSINPVRTMKNMHDGTFWENVKPSRIANKPKWMTFDDAWVDEVRRGFKACSVFLYFPLYWICYNQINNNLTYQASEMALHGVPNDVLSNLDPFALILLIPVFDLFVYPGLRKMGFNFTPIKRIVAGFATASMSMIWAAVIQAYIYKYSECGSYPSGDGCPTVPINVWAQTGSYVLLAISEILASITTLEYAFTKAPKNMRSLVAAFSLFMTAIASAIGEALLPLSTDPLLVWNYGVMAVLSAIGGTAFYLQYRSLDRDEDALNMLPTGTINGHNAILEQEQVDHGHVEHVYEKNTQV